jgi:hypothetical protein
MVYMDEFNRATTALVSPFNTEHVPCRLSVNKNSIKVTIPISQRAPAWAKRFKFVCKADAENYETIYTSLFFTQVGTNNIYFLLQGENMRKVEVGDRYIVKRDTSGALLNCAYATVLEKEAQQAGFISTTSGAAPPAGVYMKMAPEGFQAELPANAVINPGSITTNENNGGDYPLQDYPMNIWDGAAWVDYTVPAGSIIQMSFNFTRRGAGDGNNSCERRIYDNSVTLVSTANYDNMYDWWVGDNVESVLNSGTQEVGGSGNCPILNTFYPTLGIPAGDVCNNKYQFYRYGDNRLVLKITGTQRCNGSTGSERRRSSITTKITVFRTDALVVFETFPNDTLPDVFFENNLSFPIDKEGNHLSDGALGDVSQDIGSGIPGEFNTGFFNCFAFGNGIESYKVRDSLIGRAFNLGERVTTVSAQDYQEARRFADITYSGVYNQETNVNKLNEFNLGLLNFKNLEASFGDIQILDGRETDVLTLQEDKISYVLAGKNLLSDAGAGSALTSVPEVLGNQIARVEKYGISFNPESYVQWGYDRFFTDVKRGAVIQLKGDSMSQDQLAVISEANMRTWFRDEFINSFTTQKLGGYDPYMNEYVLSTNDRQLPAINLCSECGITQVFSASAPIEENVLAAQYCVELGSAVGEVSVQWEVISISEGALFDVQANYDGSTSSSGYINYGDGFSFPKSLITLTTAEIYLYVTNGEVVLSLTVYCPESRPITVIEVVLTSDQNSGETIHTQYRYVDGAYFSPLQTNSVLFDIGTNPVVSRYNATTGTQGTGAIPTDGSTLIIGTNKIVPDTYDFNTVGNSFKWLRSSTFYSATPGDIADLLSASITATPITGGPIQYQSSFVVPSTGEGYLYLIWDLRNSSVSYLCAAKDEEGIYDICCDCGPCTANCVQMSFVNKSEEDEATIYFPSGLCGQGTPITITLEPYESTEKICFVNADFYITSGDVRIEDYSCDCSCTPVCSEYVVWSNVGFCEVEFTNCSDELSTIALGTDEIAKICVLPGTLPSLIVGVANVFLVNECFCGECLNPVECWTWTAENVGRGIANFLIKDCAGNEIELSVLPSQTLTFCAFPYANPVITSGDIDFNIINTCNCTI